MQGVINIYNSLLNAAKAQELSSAWLAIRAGILTKRPSIEQPECSEQFGTNEQFRTNEVWLQILEKNKNTIKRNWLLASNI